MRIKPSELSLHFKQSLAPCYLVFGEEPLQHKEAIETIRAESKNQGYTERETFEITPNFEWESLFSSLNTQNLFSQKRLIECKVTDAKLGKTGADCLFKLIQTPLEDTLILISADKIDSKNQQSLWFTTLERTGCSVHARPLLPQETLLWLKTRLSALGFKTTPEALHTLFERTEGNLLGAAQAIEKLTLLYPNPKAQTLTINDLIDTIGDVDTRFSVFDLVDATLEGSPLRTSQIFRSLKGEGVVEPLFIVWAIAREVRTIIPLARKIKAGFPEVAMLREHGVWKRKEASVLAFIKRFSIVQLEQILMKAKAVDDVLKGRVPGDGWDTVFKLCLALTGDTVDMLGSVHG